MCVSGLAFINGAQIWALTYRAIRSESNLDFQVGCAMYAPNSNDIHFHWRHLIKISDFQSISKWDALSTGFDTLLILEKAAPWSKIG